MSSTLAGPTLALPGPWQAVVFDMDGLLVHTERQWLRAKVILFERYGAAFRTADQRAVFGAAELHTVSYLTERIGLPGSEVPRVRDEYLDIARDLFRDSVELAPGAVKLVERLSGSVPVGLASNTRRSLVEQVLAATPFAAHLEAIVTGDEAQPKPAPDLYLLACERLGLRPADAVALEDSPMGVRAAKAAGLACIGVPSDPAIPLDEADFQVGSLIELV
jgi:HAD superfamily hydrolase (TIGR01509 family)